MKRILPPFLLLTLISGAVSAQSTFTRVYNLFQANCTVGCHSGSSPSGNLNLDEGGNKNAVYNNLVEVAPTNPTAAAKGHKLIDPGYPYRSFLLTKCATDGWDNTFSRELSEGNAMPDGQPSLEKEEIELIRQWILYGAPSTGSVIDPQLLYDYYHVNGKAPIDRPAEPAQGEGFQVRTGPFFLQPGQEIEFYRKYAIENEQQEIYRIDDIINDESHHYLLFQFEPGSANQLEDGLRQVDVSNVFPDQTKYLTGWVDSDSTILPEGTAYKMNENCVLDLNYHIINYNQDSILQADAYVNIYTQPEGTAEKIMHSELIIHNPSLLIIPTDGGEYDFTSYITDNGNGAPGSNIWNIWFLSSHTHKYGTAYNIYKRNSNGQKGDILYDGNYNTTYTFNQGFYDWEHPANRYFEPLEAVDMSKGLIQEASYKVYDPQNHGFPYVVTFGLTTEDEMMLYFIQYTVGVDTVVVDPNGIEEPLADGNLAIYPNPYNDNTTVKYHVAGGSQVRLAVYNTLGEKVADLVNQYQSAGDYQVQLFSDEFGLSQGVYYVNLQIDNRLVTKKIVQLH